MIILLPFTGRLPDLGNVLPGCCLPCVDKLVMYRELCRKFFSLLDCGHKCDIVESDFCKFVTNGKQFTLILYCGLEAFLSWLLALSFKFETLEKFLSLPVLPLGLFPLVILVVVIYSKLSWSDFRVHCAYSYSVMLCVWPHLTHAYIVILYLWVWLKFCVIAGYFRLHRESVLYVKSVIIGATWLDKAVGLHVTSVELIVPVSKQGLTWVCRCGGELVHVVTSCNFSSIHHWLSLFSIHRFSKLLWAFAGVNEWLFHIISACQLNSKLLRTLHS